MEVLELALVATDGVSRVLNVIGGAMQGLVGIAQSVARAVTAAFQGVINIVEELASAALHLGTILGGVLAAGFAAVAKTGVEMNVSLQTARIGLIAITGSAQATDAYIAKLRETAKLTAPTFRELLPIGLQLAAVYGPQGLGQAVETIKAFDAAGKVLAGGNNDAITRALVQFRQLAVSAHPRQEDVRLLDLNLPGIDTAGMLKKAFGTADTKVLGEMGISGRQVADAFVKGMMDRFGAVSGQMAHSLPILFSSITDSFNDLSAAVTEKLTGSLGTGLQAVSDAIEKLSTNQKFLDALSVAFDLVGRAIEMAAAHLPDFVGWLEQIVTKENVVTLIADVAAGFQTVADEVQKFIESVMGGRTFDSVWDAFGSAAFAGIDFALKTWNGFVAGVQWFSTNAEAIFQLVVDALKPVGDWFDVLFAKIEATGAAIVRLAEQASKFHLPWDNGGGGQPSGAGSSGFKTTQMGMGGFDEAGFGKGYVDFMNWIGRKLRDATGDPFHVDHPQAKPTSQADQPFPNVPAAWQAPGPQGGPSIADRARALWAGATDAVTKGSQSGLDDAKAKWDAHVAANQAAINRMLGGGGKAPDGTTAAGGGGAAGGGAAAAGGIDPKALKELLKDQAALLEARTAAAKAQVELLPEEQQAYAALQILVPELKEQQAAAVQMLRQLRPGTVDYFKQVEQYWKLSKEQSDLQQAARKATEKQIKEAGDAAKKAVEDAHQYNGEVQKYASAQVNLVEEQLKNNPFLSDRQRKQGALGALFQMFRERADPKFDETSTERVERLTDLERVRGKIFGAYGMTGKNDFLQTAGGGRLPKFDPRQIASVQQYLAGIQAEEERSPQGPYEAGFGGMSRTKGDQKAGFTFAPVITPGLSFQETRDLILQELDRMWAQMYPAQ